MTRISLRAAVAALTLTAASAAIAAPTYVASSWDRDAVIVLDENFVEVSSFAAGATEPNGIDSDGVTIFTGHPFSNQLRAFDTAGTFLYSFFVPSLTQGLALFNNEVAVASGGTTFFYDKLTGTPTRSFVNSGFFVEALTIHEGLLWELSGTIIGRDPLTGAQVRSIPNAASGCLFAGTGLASASADRLAIGCIGGEWYVVDDLTGAVVLSGNNGIDMYGLGDFVDIRQPDPTPAPATLALLGLGVAALAFARRR